jgi:opacity protein-like surface antigen
MKLSSRAAALLALSAVAGAAGAQDVIATVQNPWEGWFVGANIGGAWNHTCSSWEPGDTIKNNPTLANAFYNRNCPNNGNFIGGIDGGYNFQSDAWVWGFKIDYEAVGSSSKSRSYTFAGSPALPAGTYTASGKISPNGILLLGPRVGYAVDEWLPWVRIGGAFTSGSHDAQLCYTPAASVNLTAGCTTGSKNVQNHGFNFGLGVDYGVQGPWSVVAEYNYVKLSKGSNSDVNCTSTAGLKGSALCAQYGQFDLSNIHNSFTMNMFRVGVHYGFH